MIIQPWSAPLTAIVLSAAISAAAFASEPAPPSYRLVGSIPLGPGERWDYVTFDPSSNRAFVAHGDHVTVVDTVKASVVGQIGTFPGGAHGIGISTATGHGYTDDGKTGMVGVFDLATLKVVKEIRAAPDADGIVFDPASGHLFVINGDSGTITVIDAAKDAVIANIAVGAGLEAGAADGAGRLYVDGAENHDMIEIDTRTNRVDAHWPMPDCKRPHGIAIDPDTRRIFATCVNDSLVVIDADTGANIATLPIGSGSDGAAFDPVRRLIFSSNGDGTLTVIREQDAHTFLPVGTVRTMPSARTIAIDTRNGRLFLPAAEKARTDPPTAPGARPRVAFVPGSLRLLVFDPQP